MLPCNCCWLADLEIKEICCWSTTRWRITWLWIFWTKIGLPKRLICKKSSASGHRASGYQLFELELLQNKALHRIFLGFDLTDSFIQVDVCFVDLSVPGGATARIFRTSLHKFVTGEQVTGQKKICSQMDLNLDCCVRLQFHHGVCAGSRCTCSINPD